MFFEPKCFKKEGFLMLEISYILTPFSFVAMKARFLVSSKTISLKKEEFSSIGISDISLG